MLPRSRDPVRRFSIPFGQICLIFFKAQPLALGAIGLAIGARIAAALPRTEMEADYLGETSDTVKAKATPLCCRTKTASHLLRETSQRP
jgi:hypothetical protein